ncbi:aldo/keto reductase [Halanaerocella petrolearia]
MCRGLEKRTLGRTGEKLTFIGFGALEIGRDWGIGTKAEQKRPAEKEAIDVLNGVLDLGINIIDTASAYHKSESRIGKALSNRRDEFFLSSKCGEHNAEPDTYYDFSYQAVKKSIDDSLDKLEVDCIDLMQIHFGPNPQQVLDNGEMLVAIKDAKQEGKIKYLGASTSNQIAKQCIESGEFDVLQLEYSLLNRTNEELIELCRKKGIGVLIKRGLAGGRLTPRVVPYLEQVEDQAKIKQLLKLVDNDANKLVALALQFLYQYRGITSVLLGSKNLAHIEKNLSYLDWELKPGIIEKANEITI